MHYVSLQHFFEGIEARVAQGVREEEVGYQLAFNKQELRKVIKEYPGKEVKKGLDNLYKKVDKHLCEEENLLQVTQIIGGHVSQVSHSIQCSPATITYFRPGSPIYWAYCPHCSLTTSSR